ncbi:MAG: hypothetical protein AAF550_02755 [Myxococcota bacterium]
MTDTIDMDRKRTLRVKRPPNTAASKTRERRIRGAWATPECSTNATSLIAPRSDGYHAEAIPFFLNLDCGRTA